MGRWSAATSDAARTTRLLAIFSNRPRLRDPEPITNASGRNSVKGVSDDMRGQPEGDCNGNQERCPDPLDDAQEIPGRHTREAAGHEECGPDGGCQAPSCPPYELSDKQHELDLGKPEPPR